MKRIEILETIQMEQNAQRRLQLLVQHGFQSQASAMVQDYASNGNMFFVHNQRLTPSKSSYPPLRHTKLSETGHIYVVANTGTQLEMKADDNSQLCFTLGWEQEALGWTDDKLQIFIRTVLNKAYMRPVNQWTLPQAHGTARVAYKKLGQEDCLQKDIMRMYYQFLFRRKDFGKLCDQLCWIPPFMEFYMAKSWSQWTESAVEWLGTMLNRLMGADSYRKELTEWLYLCPEGLDPQYVLMIAEDPAFRNCPDIQSEAVRNWLRKAFPYWVRQSTDFDDGEAHALSRLLRFARFNQYHLQSFRKWIADELRYGDPKRMTLTLQRFGHPIGLCATAGAEEAETVLNMVASEAIEDAFQQKNYKSAAQILDAFDIAHPRKEEIDKKASILNQ